jgi:LmbE family N-acetylglucosaminyl deacetylase
MTVAINNKTRILLLAPHPDDETLAAGAFLREAATEGAQVMVAFLTTGDNNPWAQRLFERRLRIGPEDRARFARIRKAEATAAVTSLGLAASCCRFLSYPDQGLTLLLLNGSASTLVGSIRDLLTEFAPDIFIYPSGRDLHRDHNAAYAAARIALLNLKTRPACLEFLIHTSAHPRKDPLDPVSSRAKQNAIMCHLSQLSVMPWRLTSHAAWESLHEHDNHLTAPGHPVSAVRTDNDYLEFSLAPVPRRRSWGTPTVYFICINSAGKLNTFYCPLRSRNELDLFDSGTAKIIAAARYSRGNLRGLSLPVSALAGVEYIFIKVQRRHGFFDDAGWQEIPLR